MVCGFWKIVAELWNDRIRRPGSDTITALISRWWFVRIYQSCYYWHLHLVTFTFKRLCPDKIFRTLRRAWYDIRLFFWFRNFSLFLNCLSVVDGWWQKSFATFNALRIYTSLDFRLLLKNLWLPVLLGALSKLNQERNKTLLNSSLRWQAMCDQCIIKFLSIAVNSVRQSDHFRWTQS